MLGAVFIIVALLMMALVLVPDVRMSVNPIYLCIWIALVIVLGMTGLWYALSFVQ